MCLCVGVPTFRWRQTLLNLLWASSSPWGYVEGWTGISNTARAENCSQKRTKCGYGQGKVWVFLPGIPLMHIWPLGNSMAETQRKISQILFLPQSYTTVGTEKGAWGRSQHTTTHSACPHFNTRDIFVFIIMGNTHEIMARLLLLITASYNVIPENIFLSHCQN